MYIFLALCTFVLITSGVWSQCTDCINYKDCLSALTVVRKRDPASRELFRAAVCGYDRTGGQLIIKVCCSQFQSEQEQAAEDIDVLANHPNINLLPTMCGDLKEPRIVGGKIADLYEFPWMALISYRIDVEVSFKCGGSIINERYILTAGHCVHRKNIWKVRVGEYDVFEYFDCQYGVCETYTQDTAVEKVIIHPEYQGLPAMANDIALLRVADPMEITRRNVQPICLPKTSELRNICLDNVNATVAGWGFTENGTQPSILRKVTIPIQTNDRCYSLYNRYTAPGEAEATANQLCAGTRSKDACHGDSGGPLMVAAKYDNVNRYVQYGVVSYARGECGADYPGVYTDVTKYMPWILDNMAP